MFIQIYKFSFSILYQEKYFELVDETKELSKLIKANPDIEKILPSILENITNKQPNERIDQDRLKLAIKCAELEEFVKNQKNNLDYILALGGQNMSGGQKQRIGIARALYKDTPLIIFDEATNALDENTESKIYSNIKKLYNEKTFICISHNKKILRFFNKKINL